MQQINLKIISLDLQSQYKATFNQSLQKTFNELHDSELSIATFSFYTSVSAVFSSKIEGENIDLDSFIKHKRFGTKYLPDYTQKTDDLYNAYLFAQKNKLTPKALEQAHAQLTKKYSEKRTAGKIQEGKHVCSS